MAERWHRTSDLAGLPGMPASARSIRLHGPARGWLSREVRVGARAVLEWLESSLPAETQAALVGPVVSLPDAGRGAAADARMEILAAFDRWRGSRPLIPALREWTELYRAGGAGVSEETRSLVPSVAWNTLQRWRSAHGRRGVAGLLRAKGGRRAVIDGDAEVREEVEAQLFARPHHATAKQIRSVVEARFPGREPSIPALQRYMRRWRAVHARALSAVADPDGHRSRRMPAFGDRAEEVEELNGLWELDSTPADVLCVDGRRHAIVAAIDVWSRRAKAVVAPVSRATVVAALIRRCLLDWGVPRVIRTDEGSDYTSRHIERVLRDLVVDHDALPAYTPDGKPFVERYIKTLNHGLLSQLPGFVGHDVADRERIRSRKSFAARRGKGPRELFRVELTGEELQEKLDAWCEHVYGREAHSGLGGLSPFERAASWAGERRRADDRGLDVLLAEPAGGSGERTVQKSGIHVDAGVYIAAELGPFVGSRVQVRRDPADYGAVFVFDAEGAFICVALDPVRTGIDRAEVAKRAKALAAQADREAREWARRLQRTRAPGSAIDDVLDHGARKASRIVAFPHRGELHRTAATDAAAEAEAAQAEAAARRAPRKTGTGGVMAAMRKIYREQ